MSIYYTDASSDRVHIYTKWGELAPRGRGKKPNYWLLSALSSLAEDETNLERGAGTTVTRWKIRSEHKSAIRRLFGVRGVPFTPVDLDECLARVEAVSSGEAGGLNTTEEIEIAKAIREGIAASKVPETKPVKFI